MKKLRQPTSWKQTWSIWQPPQFKKTLNMEHRRKLTKHLTAIGPRHRSPLAPEVEQLIERGSNTQEDITHAYIPFWGGHEGPQRHANSVKMSCSCPHCPFHILNTFAHTHTQAHTTRHPLTSSPWTKAVTWGKSTFVKSTLRPNPNSKVHKITKVETNEFNKTTTLKKSPTKQSQTLRRQSWAKHSNQTQQFTKITKV